jgi:DNA-binding MarR family transcriptional regulator
MSAPAQVVTVPAQQIEALRLAVGRLERQLRKRSGAAITPSQLSALVALRREGPMRPSELASSENVSRATATGLINRLEEKRLVRRTPHPDDARSHVLDLTDEGQRLLLEAARRSNDYLRELIGGLGNDDLTRLLDAVQALQQISAASR